MLRFQYYSHPLDAITGAAKMTEYEKIRVYNLASLRKLKELSIIAAYYFANKLDQLNACEANKFYDECLKILDEFEYVGVEVHPKQRQKFIDLKESLL